jgi:hypothetical protein
VPPRIASRWRAYQKLTKTENSKRNSDSTCKKANKTKKRKSKRHDTGQVPTMHTTIAAIGHKHQIIVAGTHDAQRATHLFRFAAFVAKLTD